MDIRDIAKRSKVSTATVSRVINQVPTVDPRLAKRVWKVIDELGYYPNRQARTLVSGRSRTLGLIVSEVTDPFFLEIVQEFENLSVENNYEILLASTIYDPKRMELSARRMIERRVDAIAVMTFGMEETLLQDSRLKNVPMAFVDVGPDAPRVSNIKVDYLRGIRQAVQHLAALRHERIAFVTGPMRFKSAQSRKAAFEKCMDEIGLTVHPELVVEGDYSVESGVKAMEDLLGARRRPTAVFCSNDRMAFGVMRKCYENRISIPAELSVIGYDDITMAQFVLPPLTTVRMSQRELARLAFYGLLTELQKETPSKHRTDYVLETDLVLRDSTRIAADAIGSKRKR